MMVHTNSQKMAQAAYERINDRKPDREFASFARSFPSLIHSCGLAQAVAFARAKKRDEYLEDVAAVLAAAGHRDLGTPEALEKGTRESPVPAYIRLSRNALQAAGWLKRYVEAYQPE
jgi:CRISPR-associated protein Cmr5